MKSQLIVVAFFAALACASLQAQSVDMRANIPFDFHAGDRLMPAGEYMIHERGPLVIFNHAEGKGASALLTFGASGQGPAEHSRLEFSRYGSAYFVTAVWNSFTQDGRQVPQTARERELAKQGDVPVPAAVTLVSSR